MLFCLAWLEYFPTNFCCFFLFSKVSLTTCNSFSFNQIIFYPAKFPLVLPLRIIFSLLEEPQRDKFSKKLVLDPYCGSGTTLVAAKLIGHNFIGIDSSENYLKQTKKRLENFVEESDIWLKEKELHVVKDTFENKKKQQKFVGKYSSQARQKSINSKITNPEALF